MSHSTSAPQMALPIGESDKASFNNYWVGHNTELVTALRASIELGEPKLVYFYGPSGTGKSHLLFAAIRLAKQEIVNTSYFSLADTGINRQMLEMIDAKHVVCIDDIHAWAGNDRREQSLFTLFEQIKHKGGQLLVTAKHPPDSSGFKLRDLISRLSGGLVYGLQQLTEYQQFEALKLRATQRGLMISDDTVRYLLSRSTRDTASLFNILDKIDHASLVEKRRITIPFLQKLLVDK